MEPLKARVLNGRLVLDEPTDLPEGDVVVLQRVEGVLPAPVEDVDDEERAVVHGEFAVAMAEADAGDTEDFADFLSRLRRQP